MAHVRRRGADPNGRPILASDYLWSWWQARVLDLGFNPTIVQGSWMSRVPGGGASASAGYHDRGGCFDLRVWDLRIGQAEQVVRNLRLHGAAAWLRDHRHGMDPHIHFVLGSDDELAPGARAQWSAYLDGRDGLAGGGRDYEWRPSPLILTPPREDDDMPYKDWPEKDRKALVGDVAEAVVDRLLNADLDPDQPKLRVRQALRQASNAPGLVRQLATRLGKGD